MSNVVAVDNAASNNSIVNNKKIDYKTNYESNNDNESNMAANICVDYSNRKNNKFRKFSIQNILQIVFYIFLMLPMILAKQQLNITQFADHPGLFFENIGKTNIVSEKWHIVTYFNMSNYWEQFHVLKNSSESLKHYCNSSSCIASIREVEKHIEDITILDDVIRSECQLRELVQSDHLRRKRRSAMFAPLNLLGNVANKFTGLLDHDYAIKMEKVISNIKSNQDRQHKLMQQHTSLLDKTVNIMRSNNKEIAEKFSKLYNDFNLMSGVNNLKMNFNTGMQYLILAIMKYREIQLQIHKALVEFKNGKLNPLIISPIEFNEHLKEIQSTLGSQHKLPSTNFIELESFIEVAVTHGDILFHIEIPLLGATDFDLYKMVPVPVFQFGKFVYIKPTSTYLAINPAEQSYYLMSNSEFSKCTTMRKLLICEERHPIFSTFHDNHCEVSLFLHDLSPSNYQITFHPQVWIEIQQSNTWLFSVKERTNVKLICEGQVSSTPIHDEGLLEIPSGCYINIKDVKIHAKTIKHSDLHLPNLKSVLPSVNLTYDGTQANSTNPFILKLNDLESISDGIESLRIHESVTLAPVESIIDQMDFHQYVTYGLFAFFLTVGISFYFFKKYCSNTIKIKHINEPSNIIENIPRIPKRRPFQLPDESVININ